MSEGASGLDNRAARPLELDKRLVNPLAAAKLVFQGARFVFVIVTAWSRFTINEHIRLPHQVAQSWQTIFHEALCVGYRERAFKAISGEINKSREFR